MSDKPGPKRSHWLSILSMRESTKEELALASSCASVRNLMQSSHTASFSYRKVRFRVSQIIFNNGWETLLFMGMQRYLKEHLFWSVFFGDLLLGALMRIKKLRHIEEERRDFLGKVDLRDFIGLELLLSLSQGYLLRFTQSNGSTHHAGLLLKITHTF